MASHLLRRMSSHGAAIFEEGFLKNWKGTYRGGMRCEDPTNCEDPFSLAWMLSPIKGREQKLKHIESSESSESSLTEDHEQKLKDIKSSQTWNNPQDDYGSQPYDGTDTTALVPETLDLPDSTSFSYTGNLSHHASNGVNAGAIIVPIFIVLILITGLTFFFVRSSNPCTSLRRSRRSPNAQALASDLESASPPRVLSPSTVPAQIPRDQERGWLFMPQLGVPNWVRGYRRRSDPRGAEDPDWQLDVNEVGEAPPEYTAPNQEKTEAEATMMQRTASNAITATGETLPGYQASEEAPAQRQDEVHPREPATTTEDGSNHDSDATEGDDEKRDN